MTHKIVCVYMNECLYTCAHTCMCTRSHTSHLQTVIHVYHRQSGVLPQETCVAAVSKDIIKHMNGVVSCPSPRHVGGDDPGKPQGAKV